MKLTTFLILAICLHVSAGGYSQKVTLSKNNVPLENVFKEIMKQTGYSFLYNYDWLHDTKNVTINAKNAPLEQVLDSCFKNQPLTYVIVDKIISLKYRLETKAINIPVVIDVHGRVTDENGDPVNGVTVTIKGSRKGTSTNANGEFNISAIKADAILVFTGTNVEAFELFVNGKMDLNVKLKSKVSGLDEVQIIAYGTTTNRLNTGDITVVSSRQIADQPVANPLTALEGRVPGLFVTQNTGVSGGSISVQLRGKNSIINGNDPFYVIDGVPYTSQMLPGYGGPILQQPAANASPGAGSPLNFINPADIESISILKDADATAIYGSRGANGAILITTKKGRSGNMQMDLNVYSGIGKVAHPVKWLNTDHYLEMRHEAFNNDGVKPNAGNAPDLLIWDTTRYTDWQKIFIGGTAHYGDAQLSLSGGNTNTQYLIGGGFHQESTVFPTDSKDQKGSVHVSIVSSSADQRFKLSFLSSYLADNNNLPYIDLTTYINTAPDAPNGFNPDGSLNWANSTWTNPYSYTKLKFKAQTNNLVSNAVLSYTLLKGLVVKSSFGYTNMQANELYLYPIAAANPAFLPTGSAGFTNNNIHSWIIEPQATYHKMLGRGKVEALVGMTFQENASKGLVQSATGYTSDALLQDIQAAPTVTTTSVINAAYKYSAGFGRLTYNYDDKYIVNGNFRRDGSSRFGPANQFHDFASIGAAWIFSNAKFIRERVGVLSFGKLYGSYGATGNDQIGDYHFYDLFSTTRYPYQGTSGLTPTSLFNPDLAWELTKKIEGGLDVGFAKDRVLLSANYYQNRSSNQLLSYALPALTGFTSIPANFPATVQNTGWEFSVNTTNIKSVNFTWTTVINVTIPGNKLLAFPNLAGSPYKYGLFVGQPLSAVHVYHLLGVNDTTGVYQFLNSKGTATYSPITSVDNTVVINTAPKLYGGMANEFTYKRVRLSFLIQFTRQMVRSSTAFNGFYPPGGLYAGNMSSTVLARWQKPGDNATFEKFSQAYGAQPFLTYQYAETSDAAYVDGSFVRLKNVALSYQLPENWMKRVHIRFCSIYLHGGNLLTITKYKGLDPETQALTILPPLRVLTAGVQLGL